MCDVSMGGGGGGSPEKRTYDVSRGDNRYVRLPLMQTKSRTKFRKEMLSSKIFTNISNNDIKIIKKMSSDKL